MKEKEYVDSILVHYGEIALKGDNREYFEEKLVDNLCSALDGLSFESVRRKYGRVLVELGGTDGAKLSEYEERVNRVFGIANYAFVRTCSRDLDSIKKEAWELVRSEDFSSFKVASRRSDKNYRLNSVELNEEVGAHLQQRYEQRGSPREVDLEEPDFTLYLEVTSSEVFVYKRKIDGPGGLPVGTAGKIVSLISAGIDSPVAAWKMMKRGAGVVFVHFHSFPRTDRASQENVREVVEVLSSWQGWGKLYLVNIRSIQRKIITKAPKRLRIIFYRRTMLRAAERIVGQENAKGVVTGDSLAQVSSQTLENLRATGESVSSSVPIYRPNIGMDKHEIEYRAREIGTYEISSRSSRDCCVYMRPKHPETKASLNEVREIEQSLETDDLISEAVANSDIEEFG
ncbi:MAG: tRNA uracil 4-sulfurtransferase ThiI [Candidatus Bipolaricaulota bacterium]|nr:tRNA 4-thiouridine(8) synthase ThiI [Candidatus Bipolaricaulota bacterium]MBS3791838.1 tRNA 4-thiouridine(8) synthase ThiI [Candidatus Bipolaricaulota bacterium]